MKTKSNVRVVKTMTITPKVAAEIVDTLNTHNRSYNHRQVDTFAMAMRGGRWEHTHQGIAFRRDGTLADGQHRLLAQVKAGVSITYEVTLGLSDGEVASLDLGTRRRVADIYEIRSGAGKDPIASRKAAIASIMINGVENATKGQQIDRIVTVLFLEAHEELIEDYYQILRAKGLRNLYHAGVPAAFALAALIYGRAKIDPVIERFANYDFKAYEDPLNALLRGLQTRRASRERTPRHVYYYYAVTAIKDVLSSKTRKMMKLVRRDFKKAEEVRGKFIEDVGGI